MTDLYYLLGLIFIYGEFKMFEKSIESAELRLLLNDKTKKLRDCSREVQKSVIKYSFFHIGYLIWTIIGLFGEQQFLFFGFLAVSTIMSQIFKSIKSIEGKSTMIKVDSVVSILMLLFIIFNYFKHFI